MAVEELAENGFFQKIDCCNLVSSNRYVALNRPFCFTLKTRRVGEREGYEEEEDLVMTQRPDEADDGYEEEEDAARDHPPHQTDAPHLGREARVRRHSDDDTRDDLRTASQGHHKVITMSS